MEIGTTVLWRDCRYELVGVDPMNVPERRAYLRDPESGRVLEAPFDEVQPRPDSAGFAQHP